MLALKGRRTAWFAIVVILLMWAAEISSVKHTSPTYDEHEYIARGYTYLQTGDTRLKLRHPILLDSLVSGFLLSLRSVQLPLESSGWASADFHAYASEFLWQANEDQADQMFFLARLPIMLLSIILAAAVYRWAWAISGVWAGLVALILCAFDPNILAHGRLVTPDIGQTTFIFLAAFCYWLYMARPGRGRLVAAGVTLGLAQAAGFPALILYPIFTLTTFIKAWREGLARKAWPALMGLVGVILVSFVTVWAAYGFRVGYVARLGINLPAAYHWEELLALLERLDRRDLAYLCGEVYRGGRWSFFVIALLIKTPIPTLLLCGLGLFAFWRVRRPPEDMLLWLIPGVYYGMALVTSLNIGYRHILPVLPFLFVLAGQVAAVSRKQWQKGLTAGLLAWLMVSSASIYPYYVAYFNEGIGGPEGGRQCLVVSDLDWGQDLEGLADYLAARGNSEIFLSYFGTAPPEHYGIRYRPIPGWPPRGNPQQMPFHPEYPLAGVYAISAANLMGARLEGNPDTYRWFREQRPVATIGHSIFVYQVPRRPHPDAPSVDLALAGVNLAELPAPFMQEHFQTNDLRLRWFDAGQALVLASPTTLLISNGTAIHPAIYDRFLRGTIPEQVTSTHGATIDLYHIDGGVAFAQDQGWEMERRLFRSELSVPQLDTLREIRAPLAIGQTVTLRGYEVLTPTAEPGEVFSLLTFWRLEREIDFPLAIFVHLLAADGSIVAQFDGLGVAASWLQPGDILVQAHDIAVPATAGERPSWLQFGLYRTDNLNRLPVTSASGREVIGDRVMMPLPANGEGLNLSPP